MTRPIPTAHHYVPPSLPEKWKEPEGADELKELLEDVIYAIVGDGVGGKAVEDLKISWSHRDNELSHVLACIVSVPKGNNYGLLVGKQGTMHQATSKLMSTIAYHYGYFIEYRILENKNPTHKAIPRNEYFSSDDVPETNVNSETT